MCFICNDEGKINGMEPNRAIYDDEHNMIDVLFGPGFICGCAGENFGSLSDEQIEKYTAMFKHPEYIFKADGEIQAQAVLFETDGTRPVSLKRIVF